MTIRLNRQSNPPTRRRGSGLMKSPPVNRRFFLAAFLAVQILPLSAVFARSKASTTDTPVRLVEIPSVYSAVGTVRPKLEARVMSQASGRIMEVSAREGDKVKSRDTLAVIEDRQLMLRLDQARRGVEAAIARKMQARQSRSAAVAGLERARSEYERIKKFLAQKAATPRQMEQAEAAYKQALAAAAGAEEAVKATEAGVKRANAAVKEVQVALGYTRVFAPFSGIVAARFVEPGDLAWPGRPLMTIMDPKEMRLEAHVREGLAGSIEKGQRLEVTIDALSKTFTGTVAEIVPSADPASRTFAVKVNLSRDKRLLSGMFGRLAVPSGIRKTLVVPSTAILRLGQLQIVKVREKDGYHLRMVRTGETFGVDVEILSGLKAGETVAVSPGGGSR